MRLRLSKQSPSSEAPRRGLASNTTTMPSTIVFAPARAGAFALPFVGSAIQIAPPAAGLAERQAGARSLRSFGTSNLRDPICAHQFWVNASPSGAACRGLSGRALPGPSRLLCRLPLRLGASAQFLLRLPVPHSRCRCRGVRAMQQWAHSWAHLSQPIQKSCAPWAHPMRVKLIITRPLV